MYPSVTEELERIGDDWATRTGHCDRYRWAADRTRPHEVVIDVACGIGYGATFFDETVRYHGYDRRGVHSAEFPGFFHPCNLDSPSWRPIRCDVAVCFETLEHVAHPTLVAHKLDIWTRRAIFVSVPTVPTVQGNPYHLHDFTVDDIPPMFPAFHVVEVWHQSAEQSHVWHLER